VSGVLGKLAELGFADVEEVESVKEKMSFQLPRELRK
jgi:4-hydroxy-3-methylbut-2-enyl diphosphate reductase